MQIFYVENCEENGGGECSIPSEIGGLISILDC